MAVVSLHACCTVHILMNAHYFMHTGGPAPGNDSYGPSPRGYYDDQAHRSYSGGGNAGPPSAAHHPPPDSRYPREGLPNTGARGNSDLDSRRPLSGGYDSFHSSSGPPPTRESYDQPPSNAGRDSYGGGGGRDSYNAGTSSGAGYGARSSDINSGRASNVAGSSIGGGAGYGSGASSLPSSDGRFGSGGGGGTNQANVGYGATKPNYQSGHNSDQYYNTGGTSGGGYESRPPVRQSRFSDANPSPVPAPVASSSFSAGRPSGGGSVQSGYNAPARGGSGAGSFGGLSSNAGPNSAGSDYRSMPPPGSSAGAGRGGARQDDYRGAGGSNSAGRGYRGAGPNDSSYGSGGYSSPAMPSSGGGGGYGSAMRGGDYSYGRGGVGDGRY